MRCRDAAAECGKQFRFPKEELGRKEYGKESWQFYREAGICPGGGRECGRTGNLWRFPPLAAQYGGGIFILVYIVLALTFGFALMTTEIAIGRNGQQSCDGISETV